MHLKIQAAVASSSSSKLPEMDKGRNIFNLYGLLKALIKKNCF